MVEKMTKSGGNTAPVVSGATQGAASPAPAETAREISLPSGRAARIRRPKGKDVMRAYELIGGLGSSDFSMLVALASVVAEIDGQAVSYEELREGDAADVLALASGVGTDAFGGIIHRMQSVDGPHGVASSAAVER